MKHTNGPWKIEGETVKTAISSGCKHIAMVNYFDRGSGDPRSISKDEHEANARLIASAPEMLEVLFELARSHSKLAQAEYNRNPSYNDLHFSHKAEESLILFLNKFGLMDEFLGG